MRMHCEIEKTYPGSAHYFVRIILPGYGRPIPSNPHPGEFMLVHRDVVENPDFRDVIPSHKTAETAVTFRREYAEAIKKAVDQKGVTA